jgi:SAM-dependent methyltransferase
MVSLVMTLKNSHPTPGFIMKESFGMKTDIDRQADSHSFDRVADLYDAFRPGYPEELVETILRKSGLPAGGKILEIGSGTGKATLPFARRGYTILCIEPGRNLARAAQDNLREWPEVRWEIAAFQDWQESPAEFDLVISAQAFHWVPKSAGFIKAANVLKAGGSLTLFWNMQILESDPMFEELQQVYRERAPGLDDGKSAEEVILQRGQELRTCDCFDNLEVYRFPWTRRYDTRQYLGLLNTYSDHLRMNETQRAHLFEGVAEVVERHGGVVDKPYQAVLYMAKVRK